MFEEARALIFAIDEYEDKSISNLQFTRNDANALREQLLDNGFREQNILMIPGKEYEKATRATICMALNDLARKLRRAEKKLSDLILVYFSGHSGNETDLFDLSPYQKARSRDSEKLQYLLPCDAQRGHFNVTAIELETFKAMVNSLRGDQIALFVDACYSGEPGIRDSAQSSYLEMKPIGNGRVYIASSAGDQPSWEEPKLGHGVFTYYLLESLRGTAACDENGFIYHHAIADYIFKHVQKHTESKQEPKVEASFDPPGVVLAINPEKYFLHIIHDPKMETYLGRRGKLSFRNTSETRNDLIQIQRLVKELITNQFDFAKYSNLKVQ